MIQNAYLFVPSFLVSNWIEPGVFQPVEPWDFWGYQGWQIEAYTPPMAANQKIPPNLGRKYLRWKTARAPHRVFWGGESLGVASLTASFPLKVRSIVWGAAANLFSEIVMYFMVLHAEKKVITIYSYNFYLKWTSPKRTDQLDFKKWSLSFTFAIKCWQYFMSQVQLRRNTSRIFPPKTAGYPGSKATHWNLCGHKERWTRKIAESQYIDPIVLMKLFLYIPRTPKGAPRFDCSLGLVLEDWPSKIEVMAGL